MAVCAICKKNTLREESELASAACLDERPIEGDADPIHVAPGSKVVERVENLAFPVFVVRTR